MQMYRNYIGGRWVESSSGEWINNVNPATGEELGKLARSTPEDVKKACEAAREAQKKWRLTPAPHRGEILFRAGEMMVKRKEELARRQTMEMGKVLNETRGDVQEGIDMTFYMAAEGRRLMGYTTPSELREKFAMAVRDPVGVVAAITPWNFPFAIPTWKIMPALIGGNAVVFKPAEDTPEMAYEIVRILEEAGLPPGVLNLVFGPGEEIGPALVTDPRVDLVSFTGSTEVGHLIARQCAELGKRVSLEMGGKNAIIVMDDADLDLATDGILWSAFGTSGQRCTAASRVIAHRKIKADLEHMVVERAKRLRLGNGLEPETEMGPVINQQAMLRIHSYTEIGKKEGARLLYGGEVVRTGGLEKGNFYAPTVFTDVHPKMRIAQEEIFGPTTAFIECDSLEQAIEINNETPYGLSSSIFTRDVNKAFKAMRDIDTGLCYVNAGTIGAEVHLPFGGRRGTGNGHREAGVAALEIFTEWKTLFIDFSGRLQKAQIDI